MLVLDTNALIFDALSPDRLSKTAAKAIEENDKAGRLAISDISLWEVAMLIQKRRIDPGEEAGPFLKTILLARSIRVLPITPEIAALSASSEWRHGDPADRIIAATAQKHHAQVLTCDERLLQNKAVEAVW